MPALLVLNADVLEVAVLYLLLSGRTVLKIAVQVHA